MCLGAARVGRDIGHPPPIEACVVLNLPECRLSPAVAGAGYLCGLVSCPVGNGAGAVSMRGVAWSVLLYRSGDLVAAEAEYERVYQMCSEIVGESAWCGRLWGLLLIGVRYR